MVVRLTVTSGAILLLLPLDFCLPRFIARLDFGELARRGREMQGAENREQGSEKLFPVP